MGLGHVELAMVQAEAAKSLLRPVGDELPGARRGQHAHPPPLGDADEQKEKYLRPLCDGTRDELLRDDRARGRRLGSDAHPDPARVPDGDDWVINGHKWFISNARRAQLRDPDRAHRGQPRSRRRPRTPASSSTFRPRAGTASARSRRCTARPATRRSASRTSASRRATCSAAAARATGSASTGSAPPASRTACAGSRRPRPRST